VPLDRYNLCKKMNSSCTREISSRGVCPLSERGSRLRIGYFFSPPLSLSLSLSVSLSLSLSLLSIHVKIHVHRIRPSPRSTCLSRIPKGLSYRGLISAELARIRLPNPESRISASPGMILERRDTRVRASARTGSGTRRTCTRLHVRERIRSAAALRACEGVHARVRDHHYERRPQVDRKWFEIR